MSLHIYACIYVCVHACVPNLYCYVTVQIVDMSLNKHGCCIGNISHTDILLHGHTDPTFLHKCIKTQASVISTSHVIAMHVPVTNIPIKCHISKSVHVYKIQLCQYKYLI